MKKRTFRLTQEEANTLHAAYLHMQDADTKTRFQAVCLYGLGYGVPQILDICGGSHSRLLEWNRAYREPVPSAAAPISMGRSICSQEHKRCCVRIIEFLMPPLTAISNGLAFDNKWNHSSTAWKQVE